MSVEQQRAAVHCAQWNPHCHALLLWYGSFSTFDIHTDASLLACLLRYPLPLPLPPFVDMCPWPSALLLLELLLLLQHRGSVPQDGLYASVRASRT